MSVRAFTRQSIKYLTSLNAPFVGEPEKKVLPTSVELEPYKINAGDRVLFSTTLSSTYAWQNSPTTRDSGSAASVRHYGVKQATPSSARVLAIRLGEMSLLGRSGMFHKITQDAPPCEAVKKRASAKLSINNSSWFTEAR